jgi:hypothetical protein
MCGAEVTTPIDSCEAQVRRMIYINSFFDGYRWPQGMITGESSALLRVMQAGMRAGQEYARSHPNAAAATYASFGYQAISAEGMWTPEKRDDQASPHANAAA